MEDLGQDSSSEDLMEDQNNQSVAEDAVESQITNETLIEIIRNYPYIWDPAPQYYTNREESWQTVLHTLYPTFHTFSVDEQKKKDDHTDHVIMHFMWTYHPFELHLLIELILLGKAIRNKWQNIVQVYRKHIKKMIDANDIGKLSQEGIMHYKSKYTEQLLFLCSKQHSKIYGNNKDDPFVQYGRILHGLNGIDVPAVKTEHNRDSMNIYSNQSYEQTQSTTLHNEQNNIPPIEEPLNFDVNIFIAHIRNHRLIWDTGTWEMYRQYAEERTEAWNSIARQMFPFASHTTVELHDLVTSLKTRWRNIYRREREYLHKLLTGLNPSKTIYTDQLTFLFTKQYTSEQDDIFCQYASICRKNNANPGPITTFEGPPPPPPPQTPSILPQFDFVPVNSFIKQEEHLTEAAEQSPCAQMDPVSTSGTLDDLTADNAFAVSLLHDYKALTEKQKNEFKIHTFQFFLAAQEERENA